MWQADTAVLVIHEFLTHSAEAGKVSDNAQDLGNFVSVLFSQDTHPVQPGHLYGPAVLTANKNLSRAVNVFIGKAVFRWRSNDGSD